MDLTIARDLGQLQARKLAIETGTDLTSHCDTLAELDTRIGNLMTEVGALRADLDQRFGFMDAKWDQLGPPYQTLLVADQVLDMVIALNKLNKICRRIESNPNLVHSEDRQRMSIKALSRFASGEEENIDLECDDKSTVMMVLDLLDSFDAAYKPLEDLLSKRDDLPYVKYATKVRALRDSTIKLRACLRSR